MVNAAGRMAEYEQLRDGRGDRRVLYVMGDIHGHMREMLGHLRGAALIDESYDWSGGTAKLWFLGDYFDRGPDGLEAINLIMHLQKSAREAGGEVGALLGNHDVHLLSAWRFSDDVVGVGFVENWLVNGGEPDDLRGLTDTHSEWLLSLPAVARVAETLLVHADSDFYLEYGCTLASINAGIRGVLLSSDPQPWRRLLEDFAGRHVFDSTKQGGEARAAGFLELFGANLLIHGHTPIDKMTGQKPEEVTGAHVYAGGLCVNVDGGMYRGGPGFLFRAEYGVGSR